ncbi:nucleolar protein 6-like [Chenopodium quinoa]|uniref:nucleolar protein 6-like n=1 Tax=Chenopodium quinoa TaxID=63459 RepID=UPI000B76EE8C|nr:nucleolar protein 6-like [Chenopodium quinoa]
MAVEPLGHRVSDLIKDVTFELSPSFTKLVDNFVSSIKNVIAKIPEDFQVTAGEAPGFVRDVGADKVEFQFKKPKFIEIGGSYSIGCIVKPEVNVDLLIRLPKDCFLAKDYLNHRYHAKRFLYLCVIKKYLESSATISKIEWACLLNEARKPILVIYPASEVANIPGFSILIIPTASSLFSIPKLNSTRNNVRAVSQDGSLLPTPKYNSSILEDMFIEDFAELIKEKFRDWEELGKALVLMKVWARQRSSIYSYDCLNGYLMAVIMSYLAANRVGGFFNKSMNAMQIFRITLDFIANSKSWEKGLLLQCQGSRHISKEELKERKQCLRTYPVVICDHSANFNLAFRISKSSFLELQAEAALTLDCIQKCQDNGFEEVFLTKSDFAVKYDYCVRLNLKGNSGVFASGYGVDDECWRLYEQKVHSLLCQGLNDRAKSIRVIWRNWSSNCRIEDGFSSLDNEPLLIGVTLSNLEKALRLVDKGPNPEHKEEVTKFRKFWGDKSEFRRFSDGTIGECVVWEYKQWEKHLIVKRIVEHVLSRHLSLSIKNVVVSADQLDFSLCNGGADPISFTGGLLEAYEALAKRLRLLDDIPLKISSVQPLDSAFRFTSVFPPEPHPLAGDKTFISRSVKVAATCVQPVEVLIQLEGSGNWPMDELATEKTKSAFLLKIGDSLQSKWGVSCIATEDDVDVLQSGYAFRLKILHERGLTLVNGERNQVKRVSSIDRKLFIQSQHSSMINGLQGRCPIYGPVVRLAKRWAASHLFSACLGSEAIELLVAHIFLNFKPFYAPNSRITGFLRFLRFLSEYDWKFSPLVVDINGDMTADIATEIKENFMSSRKAHERSTSEVSPAMFLATTYDTFSEAWTSFSPNPLELKRLVAYARSSASLLTRLVEQDLYDSRGWECLFRTPLNNYDAVVLLHRDRLAYPQRLLFPSEVKEGKYVARGNPSNYFSPIIRPKDMKGGLDVLKSKIMVDFDPLQCYLVNLQGGFSDAFSLWYDSLGGDAIGLTWNKSMSKKRDREEDSKDATDILKAVGETGKGFVRSVHLLKAPRLCN